MVSKLSLLFSHVAAVAVAEIVVVVDTTIIALPIL
jgi:hypothetical protein